MIFLTRLTCGLQSPPPPGAAVCVLANDMEHFEAGKCRDRQGTATEHRVKGTPRPGGREGGMRCSRKRRP